MLKTHRDCTKVQWIICVSYNRRVKTEKLGKGRRETMLCLFLPYEYLMTTQLPPQEKDTPDNLENAF